MNQFSGPLPSQLGLLSHLTQISLAFNPRLSGALPASFSPESHSAFFSLLCAGTSLDDPRCQTPPDLVSTPLFVAVCVLTAAVLLLLLVLMRFVAVHRRHKCMRASSPLFSLLALGGLGLLVGGVGVLAISMWADSEAVRLTACRSALAIVSVGAVTVVACVFARNFVIWKILSVFQLMWISF